MTQVWPFCDPEIVAWSTGPSLRGSSSYAIKSNSMLCRLPQSIATAQRVQSEWGRFEGERTCQARTLSAQPKSSCLVRDHGFDILVAGESPSRFPRT